MTNCGPNIVQIFPQAQNKQNNMTMSRLCLFPRTNRCLRFGCAWGQLYSYLSTLTWAVDTSARRLLHLCKEVICTKRSRERWARYGALVRAKRIPGFYAVDQSPGLDYCRRLLEAGAGRNNNVQDGCSQSSSHAAVSNDSVLAVYSDVDFYSSCFRSCTISMVVHGPRSNNITIKYPKQV